MSQEERLKQVRESTLGLDDKFKFGCNQCGKCCTYREDIILSPYDIYRLSRELRMTPAQFFRDYCVSNIGPTSRMPVVRLASVGKDLHCPLLKDKKCSVHKVKPSACALFPLGRYFSQDPDDTGDPEKKVGVVKYFLQPIECGNRRQEQTVREWLRDFNFQVEDEVFVTWNENLTRMFYKVQDLEKRVDPFALMDIWQVIRVVCYLQYDTSKDFLPQLKANIEEINGLLDDLPRLRAYAHPGLARLLGK